MDKSTPSDLSEWSDSLAADFEYAASHFHNEMELREHVHHQIAAALSELYGTNSLASSGEFNTKKKGARGSAPALLDS